MNFSPWTPNVRRGDPNSGRYRLEVSPAYTYFRIPGSTRRHKMRCGSDACGLGCRCGAWIEPVSEAGRKALASAEIFF